MGDIMQNLPRDSIQIFAYVAGTWLLTTPQFAWLVCSWVENTVFNPIISQQVDKNVFPSSLVHEGHCALRSPSDQLREELQRRPHVTGHKHIGGVNDHDHHSKEDRVEDGLFPGLQHIDASDEQVLIVQPAHILSHILHIHAEDRHSRATSCWGRQQVLQSTTDTTTTDETRPCVIMVLRSGICL